MTDEDLFARHARLEALGRVIEAGIARCHDRRLKHAEAAYRGLAAGKERRRAA